MLKKSITYFDYDGNQRTEDFYFNLTKAECMEMEMTTSGGLESLINRITKEKDHAKIVEIFKSIILKAYGEKSDDGKYFRKSKEISDRFASTEAYSELFMELASDGDEAARFVKGIMPQIPEDVQKAADFKKSMIPGQ